MFTFKVIPDNGEPFVVKASTRDVLTWERTSKGKTYAQLVQDPNLQDYYKIAHLAAWRQGQYSDSLKEFEQSHDIDLTFGDEQDDEPDPTQQGRSAGPSSPSASAPE